MLQDKCELPPLEGTKALKMRLGRGEDKFSLHSITNLGEFCYFNYHFYYLKDPSPPFIRARAGHGAIKLVPQATQKSPKLTPIVTHEESPSRKF